MANQKDITLRQGAAQPKDIVLYDLPVVGVSAGTPIYLYQGDAVEKNIVLRNPQQAPETGTVNYTLTCNAGAYAYAGNDATLTVERLLALNAGAYAYTGQDATLTYVAGDVLPLEIVEAVGGGSIPLKKKKKAKSVETLIEEQERIAAIKKQAEIDANYRPIMAKQSEFERFIQLTTQKQMLEKDKELEQIARDEEVSLKTKIKNDQLALILMMTIH